LGQRGFGGELDIIGNTSTHAPGPILGPGLRQVEPRVDQGVAPWGGIRQIHRHLGVLNPPSRAGVLSLHTDGRDTLLQIPGLVNDQHSIRIGERRAHIIAHICGHRVVIP